MSAVDTQQSAADKRYPKVVKPCGDCGQDFEGLEATKFCKACRYKLGNRRPNGRKKYQPSDVIDQFIRDHYVHHGHGRSSVRRVMEKFGWTADAVYKRAAELRIAKARPTPWGDEDTAIVEKHAGQHAPEWIAKELERHGFKRTISAVCQKIADRGLSRQISDGYSANALMACFGVSYPVVERWIRMGYLSAKMLPQGRHGQWHITEGAVARFIFRHSLEFRLRNVDQVWFLDFIRTHIWTLKQILASKEDE